jgi:hypothetical protein
METDMTAIAHASSYPPLLRWALLIDAAASAATGLLLTLGGGPLRDLLGLPEPLMHYAGLSLLPFAALVAFAATRREVPRALVWAVIACNGLWAIDSLAIVALKFVTPTWLGAAFVVVQALAVGGLGLLQYAGLARSTA